MPRRNARTPPPSRTAVPSGTARRETWSGREFEVRSVSGEPGRAYRCPGCDQVVGGGTQHVVVWPVEDVAGDDRRHWHATCWAARSRRSPTRRWS